MEDIVEDDVFDGDGSAAFVEVYRWCDRRYRAFIPLCLPYCLFSHHVSVVNAVVSCVIATSVGSLQQDSLNQKI